MSEPLPVVKPDELIKALQKDGWKSHRQKGSHLIMHKPDSTNMIVVPIHDRDIPKGTLHGIISDADLTIEEFLELLKK